MKAHPIPLKSNPHSTHLCHICDKPVSLEDAKTDDGGHTVHEDCYVLKRVTDDRV